MCDDFMDGLGDMDDVFDDPDNDFEEDLVEEHECQEDFIDEQPFLPKQEESKNQIDMVDTMILGTMIAGCAYDEVTDKKNLAGGSVHPVCFKNYMNYLTK